VERDRTGIWEGYSRGQLSSLLLLNSSFFLYFKFQAVARVTAEEDEALAAMLSQSSHRARPITSHAASVSMAEEMSPSVASTSHTPGPDSLADSALTAAQQAGRDPTTQSQLRRQMVSVGKQPKAAPSRKKRDMVG
jgi:hypothetical protein